MITHKIIYVISIHSIIKHSNSLLQSKHIINTCFAHRFQIDISRKRCLFQEQYSIHAHTSGSNSIWHAARFDARCGTAWYRYDVTLTYHDITDVFVADSLLGLEFYRNAVDLHHYTKINTHFKTLHLY